MIWQLFILLICNISNVHGNKLIVSLQPISAYAGVPFPLQPTVTLTDDDGLTLLTANSGSVQVYLYDNPSEYGTLLPSSNSFTFVNGIATTSGLYLNTIGTGYSLIFVSLSFSLQAISVSFDILQGSAYTMAFVTHSGRGTGGIPFALQPSLAITDQGGNIMTDHHTGTVVVSIVQNPSGGTLTPSAGMTVSFSNGIATFVGLKIDIIGGPYILEFETDVVLSGDSIVSSFPFTIGVGPAASVSFYTEFF